MKSRVGVLTLLIVLVMATIPTATCAANDKIQIVTELSNGKTIHLSSGDSFYLVLVDNPSVRNIWDFEGAVYSGLNLASKQDISYNLGGPVTHILKIEATDKGQQSVTINHYNIGTIDKTFELKVVVT